jgi:hypothetical protein
MRSFLHQVDRSEDEQTIRGAAYSWLYDHTTDREHYRLDRERAQALVLSWQRPRVLAYEGTWVDSRPVAGPNWTSQTREELPTSLADGSRSWTKARRRLRLVVLSCDRFRRR